MQIQIHATNIHGLGASQVVKSFLDSFSNLDDFEKVSVYLPSNGILQDYEPKNGIVKRFNRILPNSISRVIESVFSRFFFPNVTTIVLGDIPLRGIKNQVVLVHQSNLIYPNVNPYSSKKINFRISRFLFLINCGFAKKIIVQTDAMANEMIQSYPKIMSKVIVCPQPVPNWLEHKTIATEALEKEDKKVKLIYPAASYPHKKHDFLISLHAYLQKNNINFGKVEILVTLKEVDFEMFKAIPFVKNLGVLSQDEMNFQYKNVQGLLFLSSMESYGLPLIEAVTLDLPVLTVDFPYSRWVCNDEGYYFEPYSEISFFEVLSVFCNDIEDNKKPDYSNIIKKFPVSWGIVVEEFLKACKN